MAQDSPENSPAMPGPVDALLPKEMARRAERVGVEKAEQDTLRLLALAGLAGAFIAFGAVFAASVTAGAEGVLPPGVIGLLGGVAFSLAFVLVVVGGAELFTSNNLMVMAWAGGRLPFYYLLRAWGLVYIGNFFGVVTTGALLVFAGQHAESGGDVGVALLGSAQRIVELNMLEAMLLGLLGNTLVCLAIWLTYSARTTTDRVLVLIPPVTAFYALGLEHAIAVMFYLPCAFLIGLFADASFWSSVAMEPLTLSVAGFVRVLLAVTVGNIIGGGLLVGMIYWFVYLHPYRL